MAEELKSAGADAAVRLSSGRRAIAAVLILAHALMLIEATGLPRAAKAEDQKSEDPLEAARRAYDHVEFIEAIRVLKEPVERRAYSGPDLLEARSLLARCHVKTGDEAEARRLFALNLCEAPYWRPDPDVVSPDEMDVFEAARTDPRANCGKPPWWKHWYAIPIGTGVVGGIVAVAVSVFGPEDKSQTPGRQRLPNPPGPPDSKTRQPSGKRP